MTKPAMIEGLVPVVLVMNDEYFLPYSLECTRGWFSRYVIYDVGSTDRTRDIIDWWIQTNPDVEFVYRPLPFCDPKAQGTFRNSMIPETESDYYFILDADEVYTPESLEVLNFEFHAWLAHRLFRPEHIYGVVRRVEVATNLTHVYEQTRTHHRLYHRTAYWQGTHPGEAPVIMQSKKNEFHIPNVLCWHFHNAVRSTAEVSVPKRLERKNQNTYHPGTVLKEIDILKSLPILQKPIENFPVTPRLKELQDALKV